MGKTPSQVSANVFDDTNDAIRVNMVAGSSSGGGSASSFTNGSKTIGTSADQLVVASNPATKSVLVRADFENGGTVYVGNSVSVTAGTNSATDGMPIKAGEPLTIEIDNANKIYLIATASSQKVFWVAL